MDEKVAVIQRLRNDNYLAVLKDGYRLNGESVVEASSMDDLINRLSNVERVDDRWVTINGSHVLVNGTGRIMSGAGGKFNGMHFGANFKDYAKPKVKGRRVVGLHKNMSGFKAVGKKLNAKSKQQEDEAYTEVKQNVMSRRWGNLRGVSKEDKDAYCKAFENLVESKMNRGEKLFFTNEYFRKTSFKSRDFEKKKKNDFTLDDDFGSLGDTRWEQNLGIKTKYGFARQFYDEFGAIGLGRGTNTNRVKIAQGIGEDVKLFMAKVNEHYNKKYPRRKPRTRLHPMVGWAEERRIATEYLKDISGKLSPREKTQMMMLTDALSTLTGNEVNVGKLGYWSKEDYRLKKKSSFDAADSVWQHYGAYKFVYDEKTKRAMRKYMPNTIKACEEVWKGMTDKWQDASARDAEDVY